MIRRIALASVVAVLAPLTLAAPAQAKGPVSAVVSGPGIDTTRLTFDSDETELAALLDIAYPWIDGRGVWRAERPAGELGPMYSVAYRMPAKMGPHRKEVVRQMIYPFADGGAVVYTARGQTMFGAPLQHGWKTASAQLTAVMQDLGAADPNAATNAASVTPAAATSTREVDDSEAAWPWFAAVAVGIGVLVGVGALWRTRQRPNRG
jgi:hypothetical protein